MTRRIALPRRVRARGRAPRRSGRGRSESEGGSPCPRGARRRVPSRGRTGRRGSGRPNAARGRGTSPLVFPGCPDLSAEDGGHLAAVRHHLVEDVAAGPPGEEGDPGAIVFVGRSRGHSHAHEDDTAESHDVAPRCPLERPPTVVVGGGRSFKTPVGLLDRSYHLAGRTSPPR